MCQSNISDSTVDRLQIMSQPKKRPNKYLLKTEKCMTLNTDQSETETNHNVLMSDVYITCTTGTSDSSVYCVVREYKTSHMLHLYKKTKLRGIITEKIDDFDINAIRKKIDESKKFINLIFVTNSPQSVSSESEQ